MPDFTETERRIIEVFQPGLELEFEGERYTVVNCDKPRPSSGECKTDVYLLLKTGEEEKEVKISVKQSNADFLENKMSLERAKEIFGPQAQDIIKKSVLSIKDKFENTEIIFFKAGKRTEAKCFKLGWKFELVNKNGGNLSGQIIMTNEQLLDIYAGTNLPKEKKNAKVGNDIIADSGVANYIMNVDPDEDYTLEYLLNNTTRISDFIADPPRIFFACKALNYRMEGDKWDGDRPLSVYVDWSIENGKLKGSLNFDNPLGVKGNQVCINLKALLKQLNIDKDNLLNSKAKIDDSVKIFRGQNKKKKAN